MILVSFLDVSVLSIIITVIAKNIIEFTVDNCQNMKQNTAKTFSNGFMSQINSYVNKGHKFNFDSADPITIDTIRHQMLIQDDNIHVRLPKCLKMATV